MPNNHQNIARNLSKAFNKLILASIVLTTASNIPAQALTLNLSYGEGTTREQMSAFEAAGDTWSKYFTDEIILNIHVEMTDLLPNNVLGGAIPGFVNDQDYRDYYHALRDDERSQNDRTAYSQMLRSWGDLKIKMGNLILDDMEAIDLTRANAKAVGLRDADNSTMDAYILMNDLSEHSWLNWNYNFANPIEGFDYLKLDFYSVALHEIGHALGFVSGLDNNETLFQEISSAMTREDNLEIDEIDIFGFDRALDDVLNEDTAIFNELVTDYHLNNYDINPATSLDLFRQSTDTHRDRNFMDLTVGGDTFFAIDRDSPLAYFSTGEDTAAGGDGYQGSHWKDQGYFNDSLGIMAPSIGLGQRREIRELDLIALDVIGLDRAINPTIDMSQIAIDVANRVGDHLIADKTTEVLDMIVESGVYRWGWSDSSGNGNRNGNGNCNPNCNSYPQVLTGILTNEGLFSQAYWSTLDLESKPMEVPEPGIKIGLLGLSLWASSSLLKGYRKGK